MGVQWEYGGARLATPRQPPELLQLFERGNNLGAAVLTKIDAQVLWLKQQRPSG